MTVTIARVAAFLSIFAFWRRCWHFNREWNDNHDLVCVKCGQIYEFD
jgi:Fe2+ or Zn2+ uptake regulation protein